MPIHADFGMLHPISPRWTDNHKYGHLNNAVYDEYLDTAVNAWLGDVCGDVTRLEALGVVAETGCRYLSEAAFPTPLEVGMALSLLGRSSVTYRMAVFSVRADLPRVLGPFLPVYVDPVSRRPTAVPTVVAEAVSALADAMEDSTADR